MPSNGEEGRDQGGGGFCLFHHHLWGHRRRCQERRRCQDRRSRLWRPSPGIVVVLIIVAVTTLISIQSSSSNERSDHDNTYLSRDTDLVGYSNKFCDHLSISGNGAASINTGTLSLYILTSMPTDIKKELISFSTTSDIKRNHEYWLFHLRSDSRIELNACLQNRSTATFILVRGVRNFLKWKKNGNRHYDRRVSFTSICESMFNFSYNVSSNDHYYLIFENKYGISIVNISVNITQVLYEISPDIVVNNCSIPLDSDHSCNVPINYSSNYSEALLQLEPKGELIDWKVNNVVRIKCHPRVWLYAVICISAAGGVALIVAALIAILFFVYWQRKKKSVPDLSTDMTAMSNNHVNPSVLNNEELQPPPYKFDDDTLPSYKP